MKKKFTAILAIFVLLMQSVVITYADTEELIATPTPEASEEIAPVDKETAPVDVMPTPEVISAADKLSDAEYMEGLTIAFLDGVEKITPYNPTVRFEVALLRAAEERNGSAQWFVNGVPQGDYYSSEFKIYNGKLTGMNYTVPFTEEYAETTVTITLEVHLNGNIRRLEKTVVLENPKRYYDEQRVLAKVKPVNIDATITKNVNGYSSKYLGEVVTSLTKGQKVYYADQYSSTAAYIYIPSEDRFCWVPYNSISVSNKNYTVYEDFTNEEKELFVNAKKYTSDTFHLIWINLERQKVNFFKIGEDGEWKLEKTMPCATGTNLTPTPTGIYTYTQRSTGWFNPTYYVKPVLYIDVARGIAMHSILFNPNGTVQDGTMGRPASHACIRMMPDDINYLNDNLGLGSTVVVY